MVNVRKARIAKTIVDVVTAEEALANGQVYPEKYTAMEYGDYILPITSGSACNPCVKIYPTSVGNIIKAYPPVSDEDKDLYKKEGNVIDFNDAKTFQEVIQKEQEVRAMTSSLLLNPDNVFEPIIQDKDTPEMKALKEAITAEHIDLDAYASKFGANYANDKRLLRGSSITLGKMRSVGKNMDMSIKLIIEDAAPDVPNPIGRSIMVDLTNNSYE